MRFKPSFLQCAVIILLLNTTSSPAQTTSTQEISKMTALPYDTLPAYAENYTAAGVAARMVDGLGFRYRWATEGLRKEDLAYQPDSTARSSMETMDHLLGLSNTIINAVQKQPNIRPTNTPEYSWKEKRALTLSNLKTTSEILWSSSDEDLKDYKIVFQRGDNISEFPFWHHMNGPIADALWHCGQVVSMRRSSGNPIDSRVNVFMGRLREK